MIADRSGSTSRIAAPVHRSSDPRVSPGGRRIAVHVFEEGRDNWVLDLRSGAFTRLTFDPGEDETPVWSPDGKWIFWTSTRENVNRAMYRKAADGSGAEQSDLVGRSSRSHRRRDAERLDAHRQSDPATARPPWSDHHCRRYAEAAADHPVHRPHAGPISRRAMARIHIR